MAALPETSAGEGGVALLERDGELAALEALIGAAASGGRLLAIEGPAGIGKSRLLAEARARASAGGLQVLAARGSELEQEFSYGIVRQLFEPVLAAAGDDERAALVAGAAELAMPVFDPGQLRAGQGADASHAMLHGLFWLTANFAERQPLLVAIDDLHWCDPPSLRWLAYLLPRLEGLRVLAVVTLRPAEPGADLAALGRITVDPVSTVVRPRALSVEATGELLRGVLAAEPDATFRAAAHEASGGNPLFVREIGNALAAEDVAPTAGNTDRLRDVAGYAVSRSVLLRLAGLSPAATRLAQAVAVLGDDADPGVAAALSGLTERAVADAAADLARVEILRPSVPLGFVHPVVRAAVYAELAAIEKDRLHIRAARLLSSATADPERVSAQLLLSTRLGEDWALDALRAAAANALRRGAPDGAAAYLGRALDEASRDDRGALLHELGVAEARFGAPQALDHLAAALAATRDAAARARIAADLAATQFSSGYSPKVSGEILQQALAELPEQEQELALELEIQLIGIARYMPDLYPLATERLERLRVLAPPSSRAESVVFANLASEAARAGTARADAIAFSERALAEGRLFSEHFDPAFLYAVQALDAADELEAAFRLYTEAMEYARRNGLITQFCFASCYRSLVAHQRGQLADAIADAEISLGVIASYGLDAARPAALAFLVNALVDRGELARAHDCVESATFGPLESTVPLDTAFVAARARLRLAEGDYEQAVRELVVRGRYVESFGVRNPALFPWRSLAALGLIALGRRDEARRHAADEVELARRWGAPRTLGESLIAAGLSEGGETGIALLEEAVATLGPSQARLEHARALVELGAALRRGNRRAEARDPLRRGLELATICGAARVAETAETELLATGARPRRVALSGIDSLTPSERRVADLAAGGSTNREIAQSLFVTPRTVEVHLTSAYRKLGITSRSQLPKVLESAD